MAIRNQEMLRELGVRYVITHEGAVNAAWLAASPVFRLVGPDNSFYRVYEFLCCRPGAPYGLGGWRGSGRRQLRTAHRLAARAKSVSGGFETGRPFLSGGAGSAGMERFSGWAASRGRAME